MFPRTAAFFFCSMVLASTLGCVSSARNLQPSEELKGRKVLSGRLLMYKDDKAVKSGFIGLDSIFVFFNKDGEKQVFRFEPDAEGYVYTPVTPGRYLISEVRYRNLLSKKMVFIPLNPMPTVEVGEDQGAINFGSLEIRLKESLASKVSSLVVPVWTVNYTVKHMEDCAATHSEIAARLKETDLPIADQAPAWYQRK